MTYLVVPTGVNSVWISVLGAVKQYPSADWRQLLQKRSESDSAKDGGNYRVASVSIMICFAWAFFSFISLFDKHSECWLELNTTYADFDVSTWLQQQS